MNEIPVVKLSGKVCKSALNTKFKYKEGYKVKSYYVKDLMVSVSEYATAPESASLYEAVLALEKAQEEFDSNKYRHRGILILDKNDKVIGKISQLDVLRALEPKYKEMLERNGLARYGFTKTFMKSMLDSHNLWADPLKDICEKANDIPVSSFMETLSEGEYIEENATLDEAIHQIVLGHHQSLIVIKSEEITGILRLTDIFAAVFHTMKECHPD